MVVGADGWKARVRTASTPFLGLYLLNLPIIGTAPVRIPQVCGGIVSRLAEVAQDVTGVAQQIWHPRHKASSFKHDWPLVGWFISAAILEQLPARWWEKPPTCFGAENRIFALTYLERERGTMRNVGELRVAMGIGRESVDFGISFMERPVLALELE